MSRVRDSGPALRPLAGIPPAVHERHRRQLMAMAGEDAIVIVPAAPQRVRSGDTFHAYRQDSNLWYLTGFAEPDAVLVLVPGRRHGQCLLFCRERDPVREGWDGPRLGPEGAVDALGMDDAYPIDDMDEILPGLLEGRPRVYHHFGRNEDFDLKLIGWFKQVQAQVPVRAQAAHEFLELGHLLDEMRLFKTREELVLMRRAAAISVRAHAAAMRAVQPGMYEYELQAELEYAFRRHGGQAAYESIVGAGANGCVLHYGANRARIAAGDLVLIDAGAEYAGYAADISRTFPASGEFSPAQRALHDLVHLAQAAALAEARPGVAFETLHETTVRVLAEGMLALGLLKGQLQEVLAQGSYRRFYPHKSGHWLGLDVHDVGEYRIDGEPRLLEPGMVFTIEPGIYVPPDATDVDEKWRGIGIRIEDDVLVTREGHEVLTTHLARSADEVEAFMAAARS